MDNYLHVDHGCERLYVVRVTLVMLVASRHFVYVPLDAVVVVLILLA
jgi:hypothetical protein